MKVKLSKEIKAFILRHQDSTLPEIALLLSKKPNWPKAFILDQINGRQKAKKKFPFLIDFPDFHFPSSKAVAQSSSSLTAKYKATLLKGKTIIDACGGMGIDSYFFSKLFDSVFYIEPNEDLFEISKDNFKLLGSNNIECFCADIQQFLSRLSEKVDCIFLDPDRRKKHSKAFRIEDCEPNLIELMPLVWQKTQRCLIKLSPMLDISLAISQLQNCKEIHVISVENECKELLFILEKDFDDEAHIICNELSEKAPFKFTFKFSEEKNCAVEYSDPLQFLYEPNVAILKAGAFKDIGAKFSLKKLASNTHLYTSTTLIDHFPGRTFKINSVHKPQKGLVKKANISAKNFPLSPVEIGKKYHIKTGALTYLFACGLSNSKNVFILCEKVPFSKSTD